MSSARKRALDCSLLLLLTTVSWSNCVEIDNGVVGTPTISCGTEMISFWVKTRNPFKGKVYVKGEYGKAECTTNFANMTEPIIQTTLSPGATRGSSGGTRSPIGPPDVSPAMCPPCPQCVEDGESQTINIFSTTAATNGEYGPPTVLYTRRRKQRQAVGGDTEHVPEMAHLTVKLGTCNIKRDRTLSPAGVQVSFTVVVSFHEHFVTKVDRAYQIQCAYMESDKTVTSQIDVSMPQTTEITAMANMPQCEYSIRRESPEGAAIRYAKVGDAVYHRWECKSEMQDMFGMLVHDCVVSDGQGQQEAVIDAKGCSIDAFVVPNLNYDTSLLAYVEAHVFKFADRAVLDFQCAMTICVKQGGGCEGITPPACERAAKGRNRQKRDMVMETVNRTLQSGTAIDDENQWRLHAQRLTVVDLDENIKSDELETFEDEQVAKNNALQKYGDYSYVDNNGRLQYYRRIMDAIGPRVCLSVAGFGVLVAVCTFVFTVAAVIFGALYVLRNQRK